MSQPGPRPRLAAQARASLRHIVLSSLLCGCSGRALPLESRGPGTIASFDLAGGTAPDLAYARDAFARDLAVPRDLALPERDLGPPSDLSFTNAAQCLTGGSIIYFDGDSGDYIHPGIETIHVDQWSGNSAPSPDTFWYSWNSNAAQGVWWYFAFSSRMLNAPLAVGRYDNAMRYPFESAGHPGFDISGSGRGCNTESGWFEILSVAGGGNNGNFTELTATFEQHCEGSATAALRGCIHFQSP